MYVCYQRPFAESQSFKYNKSAKNVNIYRTFTNEISITIFFKTSDNCNMFMAAIYCTCALVHLLPVIKIACHRKMKLNHLNVHRVASGRLYGHQDG